MALHSFPWHVSYCIFWVLMIIMIYCEHQNLWKSSLRQRYSVTIKNNISKVFLSLMLLFRIVACCSASGCLPIYMHLVSKKFKLAQQGALIGPDFCVGSNLTCRPIQLREAYRQNILVLGDFGPTGKLLHCHWHQSLTLLGHLVTIKTINLPKRCLDAANSLLTVGMDSSPRLTSLGQFYAHFQA